MQLDNSGDVSVDAFDYGLGIYAGSGNGDVDFNDTADIAVTAGGAGATDATAVGAFVYGFNGYADVQLDANVDASASGSGARRMTRYHPSWALLTLPSSTTCMAPMYVFASMSGFPPDKLVQEAPRPAAAVTETIKLAQSDAENRSVALSPCDEGRSADNRSP